MDNLVEKCLQGDSQACTGILEQCSDKVSGTIKRALRKYTGRIEKDEVDDFSQQFFIHLCENDWKRLRKFKGNSSVSTYINVIAVNFVLDTLRRRKEHVSLDDGGYNSLKATNPPLQKSLELSEAEKILKGCMEDLKPKELLLMKLAFYKEMPPREICTILKISPKAASDRKRRVIKKLKDCAEKHGLNRLY